jgi:hypothetical protein
MHARSKVTIYFNGNESPKSHEGYLLPSTTDCTFTLSDEVSQAGADGANDVGNRGLAQILPDS